MDLDPHPQVMKLMPPQPARLPGPTLHNSSNHLTLSYSPNFNRPSGLNVRVGSLTPNNSSVKLSHFLANTSARGAAASASRYGSSSAFAAAAASAVAATSGLAAVPPGCPASPQAAAAAAAATSWDQARSHEEELQNHQQQQEVPSTAAARPPLPPSRGGTLLRGSGPSLQRLPPVKTTSLQQAYGQLLEAFRWGPAPPLLPPQSQGE